MVTIKRIALVLVCAAYVISLCALAIPFAAREGLFVSPDEHATWTFAQEVASTGVAVVEEQRNEMLAGLLHPRSTVTVGQSIVPAGFLGMPYIAGVLYFLSPYAAALAGPLFGILGLCAWYGIIKKMGATEEFAALSVGALALHPAWWYYSARSLMPNIPFVSLILCAGWIACSIKKYEKAVGRYASACASGALFALAVFIRPSEWLWLAGAILVAALFVPLRAYKKEIASGLLGFLVVASVAFMLQDMVYGGALTTGYTVDIPAWEVGGEVVGSNVPWHEKVFALLFPFGIHEKSTLRNAWSYLVLVYPWMTFVAALGGFLLLPKLRDLVARAKDVAQKRTYIVAIIVTVLSAVYLVILYGSWTFYDNPDPSVVSIGNSHVRYWLPIIIASTPLAAHAMLFVKSKFLSWSHTDRSRSLAKAFPAAVLVLLGAFSAHTVFAGDDGILHTREALMTFAEKRSAIVAATPENAVIIVDRADKYLWPGRAVVVPLRSEKTYESIPKLLDSGPLYYFSITLPDEDLSHLHEVIFAGTGITFTPVFTINEETLYVISR